MAFTWASGGKLRADSRCPECCFRRSRSDCVRDSDYGLGGEMEDGLDFVFAERAFEEVAIAHVAADDVDGFESAGAHDFALRHPIALPGRPRLRRLA